MQLIYLQLFGLFLISFFGTMILNIIFRFFGKRRLLGNLYQNIRGGTPRAIGLIPFILLSLFLPQGYNNLVLIIGIFAFIDDLLGRVKIFNLSIEWGQLSRGIGMLLVMAVGYPIMGWSAILVALMVQPLNISDMQPGSTCSVVLIMSVIVSLLMILTGVQPISELPAFYTPILIIAVCLGYAPLDYSGKIMLGEVGNHSFAIALGIAFYMLGGFWWTLIFFIITTILIAFIRRNSLNRFLTTKLKIYNPTPGDYFMDVLTGGGLGDILRKLILKNNQITVTNTVLILLGFRRLLYNPYAPNNKQHFSNDISLNTKSLRKF
ncbi:MAG: cell wall biosynthesis protein [Methanobacteriaceae archaeon]|nr:cell wall biosynthesis protein [Methanobacteriaceae archaeon]